MNVTKTMSTMNKVMDPQKTARTMQEFERQNMKMEMTEEMSLYYICRLSIHVDVTFHSTGLRLN